VNTQSAPNSGFSTPATVERRRSARQDQAAVEGWLSDPAEGGVMSQQQRLVITDLSLHGVGFRCSKLPEKGAAHWLVIATDKLHLSTRIRVVNVRQREDGQAEVGAEFF
jgi:hypothetical protein